MHIQFSDQFGGDVWDVTRNRAAFAEDTCNSTQLLEHLETALGLPQVRTRSAVRTAALLGSILRDESAYYQASAQNDALGCARRLLRDYDTLRLHGWDPHGEDTPRLRALATLCQQAPPGMAERLARVAAAMPARRAHVDTITLHQPMASLPHGWRRVLRTLAETGTHVAAAAAPPEPPLPVSTQLLTPGGPLEAAEHVAAWLRTQSVRETVVVTPDATLETALRRHGLPTMGIASPAATAAVQLVLLTVHMAFQPMHPRLAVEFLSISPNPLSWELRRRLLDALGRWPAVGSTTWCEAITTHGQEAPDVAANDTRALANYFEGSLRPMVDPYPLALLQTRVERVRAFLAAQTPPDRAALDLCDSLCEAARVSGGVALSEGQLQRLLAMAVGDTPGAHGAEAQAGLFPVSNAASIIAPVKNIVWWDFTAESVQPPRLPTLLHADAQHLQQRHVALPSLAQMAAATAVTWRRPLLYATHALLLVTPRASATGESNHPHPLWDEIPTADKQRVRQPTLGNATQPQIERPLRPLPNPMTLPITVEKRVLKRDGPESPHSMETMLGCSVRWALHYLGRLEAAQIPPLRITGLQIGSFAHHLLETLCMAPYTSAEDAAEQARRAFDQAGPTHLAPLYLPGHGAKRHELQVAFADAVKKLAEIRTAHGWRIEASEVEVSKPFHTIILRGILDARLDNPKGILDFKWSGSTRFRDKLIDGTALQLAIYSYLCADDATHLLPIAYYVLDRAKLLTPEEGKIAGAEPLRGSVNTLWHACKGAMLQALQTLEGGTLTAPGNDPAPMSRDTVENGVLRVAPPCMYCNFGALCGAQWGAKL